MLFGDALRPDEQTTRQMIAIKVVIGWKSRDSGCEEVLGIETVEVLAIILFGYNNCV
jgi:hypothetical protein